MVQLVAEQAQAGFVSPLLAAPDQLTGRDAGPSQAEVCHPDQCNADPGDGVTAYWRVGMFPFMGKPLCDVPVPGGYWQRRHEAQSACAAEVMLAGACASPPPPVTRGLGQDEVPIGGSDSSA